MYRKSLMYQSEKIIFLNILKMGCPALGVWVAFLKQPDALPGRAASAPKKFIFELLLIHL
jgi:hypothetical protein